MKSRAKPNAFISVFRPAWFSGGLNGALRSEDLEGYSNSHIPAATAAPGWQPRRHRADGSIEQGSAVLLRRGQLWKDTEWKGMLAGLFEQAKPAPPVQGYLTRNRTGGSNEAFHPHAELVVLPETHKYAAETLADASILQEALRRQCTARPGKPAVPPNGFLRLGDKRPACPLAEAVDMGEDAAAVASALRHAIRREVQSQSVAGLQFAAALEDGGLQRTCWCETCNCRKHLKATHQQPASIDFCAGICVLHTQHADQATQRAVTIYPAHCDKSPQGELVTFIVAPGQKCYCLLVVPVDGAPRSGIQGGRPGHGSHYDQFKAKASSPNEAVASLEKDLMDRALRLQREVHCFALFGGDSLTFAACDIPHGTVIPQQSDGAPRALAVFHMLCPASVPGAPAAVAPPAALPHPRSPCTLPNLGSSCWLSSALLLLVAAQTPATLRRPLPSTLSPAVEALWKVLQAMALPPPGNDAPDLPHLMRELLVTVRRQVRHQPLPTGVDMLPPPGGNAPYDALHFLLVTAAAVAGAPDDWAPIGLQPASLLLMEPGAKTADTPALPPTAALLHSNQQWTRPSRGHFLHYADRRLLRAATVYSTARRHGQLAHYCTYLLHDSGTWHAHEDGAPPAPLPGDWLEHLDRHQHLDAVVLAPAIPGLSSSTCPAGPVTRRAARPAMPGGMLAPPATKPVGLTNT